MLLFNSAASKVGSPDGWIGPKQILGPGFLNLRAAEGCSKGHDLELLKLSACYKLNLCISVFQLSFVPRPHYSHPLYPTPPQLKLK